MRCLKAINNEGNSWNVFLFIHVNLGIVSIQMSIGVQITTSSEVFVQNAMHVHVSKSFSIDRCSAQIKELKEQVASLDYQLAHEHERATALGKDLAMAKQSAAALDSELVKAHLPYDFQIKDLKQQVNHLDRDLARQLQEEEAVAKQLADEKLKSTARELKLQKVLADQHGYQQELAEITQVCTCKVAKGFRCGQIDMLAQRVKCD